MLGKDVSQSIQADARAGDGSGLHRCRVIAGDERHDIRRRVEGLLRMHRYLFASRAEREQLIAEVVA